MIGLADVFRNINVRQEIDERQDAQARKKVNITERTRI